MEWLRIKLEAVYVGFMVDYVALMFLYKQFVLQLSVSFHHCPIFIFHSLTTNAI
jgi:hypothetical protein